MADAADFPEDAEASPALTVVSALVPPVTANPTLTDPPSPPATVAPEDPTDPRDLPTAATEGTDHLPCEIFRTSEKSLDKQIFIS